MCLYVFTSIIQNYKDENVVSLIKYACGTQSRVRGRARTLFPLHQPVCASGKSALLLYVEFVTSLSMNRHHKNNTRRVTWAGKLKSHNAVLISHICRLSFRLKWRSCNGVYPEHEAGGELNHLLVLDTMCWGSMIIHIEHKPLRVDDMRERLMDVIRLPTRGYTRNWIGRLPATLPRGYSYSAFVLGALPEAVGNVWKHFNGETFHMSGIVIQRICSNWPPVIIR